MKARIRGDPVPGRRQGVLILCGDADGNLGDRAILAATCEAIRSVEPSVPIAVVSRDPERLGAELEVDALIPGFRGITALMKAIRHSRVVFVGGGGLFQDDDSRIKMPYWAARCCLARFGCSHVVGHSLGVGPLEAATSRLSARMAFATMSRVAVRDPRAYDTARRLTSRPVSVVPDPAFMLAPDPGLSGEDRLAEAGVQLDDGPLIGVALRRWFPPRARWIPHRIASRHAGVGAEEMASDRLLDLWAMALDRVLETTGGRVVMLPTYTVPHEGDDRLCDLVRARMRSKRTHLVQLVHPAEYLAVLGCLSVMVGGRMHPTILAASAGTPIVGLSYNPKFEGVFELLGLPQRCMSVEDLVETGDVEGFARLIVEAVQEPRCSPDSSSSVEVVRSRARSLAEQTRAWVAEVMASC
jgi:polysaccharide pyruvyl transferase WcaK-like protein